MTLGALVGVVPLVSTFVAGDLFQRRWYFDKCGWRMVGNSILIILTTVIHCINIVAVLQGARILFTGVSLVPQLATIMACGKFLVQLILAEIGQRRQLEAWVHVLAIGSFRTKAG